MTSVLGVAIINVVSVLISSASAAIAMHHAYRHGLLEHTVHMLQVGLALLPIYKEVDFDLAIHGESSSYTADVLVTRTESGVLASTVKPIIVMADTHGLVSGVEALREVAGLPSISRAVPVSFNVVFEQGH